MPERYEYAVADEDAWAVMPERWAQAVIKAMPDCTLWRCLVHINGQRVTHGEWHPVTAGGER